MDYLLLVAFVRAFVEGAKKVLPGWFTEDTGERNAKVLVFGLSVLLVFAYRLNAVEALGLQSFYPAVDYMLTVVGVAYAAMVGHDIFDILARKA